MSQFMIVKSAPTTTAVKVDSAVNPKPAVSEGTPQTYPTIESAKAEAEKEAKLNLGVRYEIYELVGHVVAEIGTSFTPIAKPAVKLASQTDSSDEFEKED